MPNVAELELYDLPISEQFFADDPNPHMVAARKVHPWLARAPFAYVITDYDAIEDMLRMDETLQPAPGQVVEIMGGKGTNWARFQHDILLGASGDKHDHVRLAVNMDFLPKSVNTYRTRVQKVVAALLDEWAPKGRFAFEEFAALFPIAVMFGIMGVPQKRIAEIQDWLEMMGLSYSLKPQYFPKINESFDNLWVFAQGLVKERRTMGNAGEPDLLDTLIAAQARGAITEEELLDLIITLFVGGYDTSKNQLAQIMNLMVDRPEVWRRCAEDRNYCDAVLQETMRHSGVATTYRNVAAETEYRGVKFPVGTMLVFPLSVVARYSGQFEDGLEFKPGRANAARHQGFGRGVHICIGQHLVRLQVAEGLHLIAQRLRNPRRDGATTWRPFTGVWGPKHLPIVFDAA
jgi:cytochrome P450